MFLEFNQDYYLALLQHNYDPVENLSTTIIPEHRCLPIQELLDHQIQAYSRWHCAKYYHIPCQQQASLVCFYDNDQFMCLYNIDRFANCFKFDFNRTYNCLGYNFCENGGQCYQDDPTCPTTSSCFCTKCYYVRRCQFTSTGFGLSLDAILGYSIWSHVTFSHQPTMVKISTALTALMFTIAILNSVLSIITFQTKRSLECEKSG